MPGAVTLAISGHAPLKHEERRMSKLKNLFIKSTMLQQAILTARAQRDPDWLRLLRLQRIRLELQRRIASLSQSTPSRAAARGSGRILGPRVIRGRPAVAFH